MASETTQNTGLKHYSLSTAAFLVSLGLLLLTVVDIRRGFLFSNYFEVGAHSRLLNLDLGHLPLLLVGSLGAWLSYRAMRRLESNFKQDGLDLKSMARGVAMFIGTFLIIDLFTYRGVPTSQILAAGEMGLSPGTMGLGWAMPIYSFQSWLQPMAEGINYLLVVWHAARRSFPGRQADILTKAKR
ncbi:MAG: hypothetical protein QGI51_00115 [Dehalococcoidales bacterium]|jgi:hypothetical protein|nr:hypothetical protein [Dehalococcoidales bacterium]